MTELEALVAINMVTDIGSIRLKKLLEFFGTAQNILKSPPEKLTGVLGAGEKTAHRLRGLHSAMLKKEFDLAGKLGLTIVAYTDERYPASLKQIPGYPIVLYVSGTLLPEDALGVAIVGSRRASFYGLSCAEQFAQGLSAFGVTVVSGMAAGIDTCAHKAALRRGGRTIAVMGSGFNHVYPRQNAALAREIAANGAVISEFPMDALPLKQHFPRRNRIISGLSLGVLVVEAAKNSGALITADFALEQGREVFALPGKIDSGTSFGTNRLIQQGAKLVSCAQDIVEEFVGIAPEALTSAQEKSDCSRPQEASFTSEESSVHRELFDHALSLDEIAEKTNMDISKISDILLKLQLKKAIRQLPGAQFARA